MRVDNFAWIATWKITRRCNLHCVYCDHASMRPATFKESIDYEKAVRTIGAYAPKIVNISGGEPTLIENLPEIVSEIKKQWNPFIRIVHNGTDPEKLIPCLPHMDRLVVSIDGPDPVQKANRGISAESIYKKLKPVLPEIAGRGVEVYFNCVLSAANVKYMRQLALEARQLSNAITVSFTPIMPPDSETSLLGREKQLHEFLETYHQLQREGFSVMHVFDGIRRHDDHQSIQCYNQYFTIRISPEGLVWTCAMNIDLNAKHYGHYFGKLFSKKGMGKAITSIKKIIKRNLHSSPDFSCSTMCACENWLDLIFLGIQSDCISHYAKGLSGRLTETDLDVAQSFVQKHINPHFKKEFLKRYINA